MSIVCVCLRVSESDYLGLNPGSDIISHMALSKLLNLNFFISKVRNNHISFKWLF